VKRLVLCVVVGLAACGGDSSNDVVGPFTGQVRRFHLDVIDIPKDGSEAAAVAADLDGDEAIENQFGNVTGVLAGTNDVSRDSGDMILSGALASVVDIQADDLTDDASAGVTYYGADGEPAVAFGGRFTTGAFVSNRTRDTDHPGLATVHIPVFTNSDPLVLTLEAAELELAPDGDGYTGIIRGGFREEAARATAFEGLTQMFEDEPERHIVFARSVDSNHDGVVSRDEVGESVINLLVAADVDLFDGDKLAPHPGSTTNDCISVAYRFHLSPMAPIGTPQVTCRDRARDGDETDVDCGGSCQACWGGKACGVPGDCQSNTCDAGTCRAPSCTDGVRDAFESDVDCGGPCAPCATGLVCAAKSDCQSGSCDNALGSLGHCL